MGAILNWFDQNPNCYWIGVFGAMGAQLFFILRAFLLNRDLDSQRQIDWRWSIAIGSLLFAGRWPTFFLNRQLNDDEGFLITGAMTLQHDPVIWRSVDGGTAGPLDFYALMPVAWITGEYSYFSARITALCFIAIALTSAYFTLSLIFDRQLARVTLFPAVCVESLTLHPDFLHYSTELVPIASLSTAFFLLTRRIVLEAPPKFTLAGGLLLGIVPFAKLQAAPIAAVLGAAWFIHEVFSQRIPPKQRKHQIAALLGGATTPALLLAIPISINQLWPYVTIAYFKLNATYASAEFASPLYQVLIRTWVQASAQLGLLFEWIAGGMLWILLCVPFSKEGPIAAKRVAAIAVATLLSSVFCVLVPHRAFFHYWQLAVIPWTLVIGCSTGLVFKSFGETERVARCALLCSMMMLSLFGVFDARAVSSTFVGRGQITPQVHSGSAVVRELGRYVKPGESLGLWGWKSDFNVEAQLVQATRRMTTSAEIVDGPYRDYFRSIYLSDLRKSAPPVFLDATGPGNPPFETRQSSFEFTFPALAEYIDQNYWLRGEVDGVRIYVRNDRKTFVQ